MILESMFWGNFAPMDLLSPSDPEYKKLNQEICNLKDRLKENRNPENQGILDDMLHKIYTAQAIECESYFGFAMAAGMQLQMEVQAQLKGLEENARQRYSNFCLI